MSYRPLSTLCGRGCGRPRRHGGRLCAECHAESMRAYRNNHSHELARLIAEFVRLRGEVVALQEENRKLRRKVAAI